MDASLLTCIFTNYATRAGREVNTTPIFHTLQFDYHRRLQKHKYSGLVTGEGMAATDLS